MPFLQPLHRAQVARSRVRGEPLVDVDDDRLCGGRALGGHRPHVRLGGLRKVTIGGEQAIQHRRAVLGDDGHPADAQGALIAIDDVLQALGLAEGVRVVDDEGFSALVDADDRHGVRAFFTVPRQHEGDAGPDQATGQPRRDGEKANVAAARPQPVCRGPRRRPAERDLRRHVVRRNANPVRRQGRRQARGQARVALLHHPPVPEAQPPSLSIPTKV